MPNKPDKFRLKFWLMAEVKFNFLCNILPYLVAFEIKLRNCKPLREDVVMRRTASTHNNTIEKVII